MPRVSKHIKDGLTVKQRKLAKELAKGESKADASRKAGYNSKHPTADVNKQLQKPELVVAVKKEEERLAVIAEKELSNDRLIQKHSELLEAQDATGNSDNTTQFKALESAYKLKRAPGYGTETQTHLHAHADVTSRLFKDLEEGRIINDSDSPPPEQGGEVEGSDS